MKHYHEGKPSKLYTSSIQSSLPAEVIPLNASTRCLDAMITGGLVTVMRPDTYCLGH